MDTFVSSILKEYSAVGCALIGVAGFTLGLTVRHSSKVRRHITAGSQSGSAERTPKVEGTTRGEEDVAASERSLRLLIDTIPALVWRTSPTGMNEYANRRLLEFSGQSLHWFRGVGWQNLIHPDDLPPTLAIWQKALDEGAQYRNSFRLLRKDGIYRWFEVRGEPFRDESGLVIAYYGVLFDIDDRKRAEDALMQTRARLTRAAQAATLAELSASVAHEINQPLQAIVSNGEACQSWILKDPPNIDRALLTVERVVRDGKAAAAVVSKIRGLFRKASPRKGLLDLNDAIREVLVLMADEIAKRGAAVNIHLEQSVVEVLADRIQMQQVLTNLITNAIEAMEGNPAPEKVVTIRTDSNVAGAICVHVVDRGNGTSDVDSIFDSFFTTKESGMGMGLTICRAIVDSHGGQLRATRNADAGMTVSFSLPSAKVEVSE